MSDSPTPDTTPIIPTPTALDVWASQPFQSNAERIAAYASTRYSDEQDQVYRDAIAAKEMLDYPGSRPNIYAGTGAQSSNPNASVGRMSIHMTDEDVQGVQQHVEEQRREAERQEALKANERQLATELTIPMGPPIDRTKPAEAFADRDDMVRHMRDGRYGTDAAYRAWVEARVLASDF